MEQKANITENIQEPAEPVTIEPANAESEQANS
jgi:hypothetical protein